MNNTLWRTLVRIQDVWNDGELVVLAIPATQYEIIVKPESVIPSYIPIETGVRFYCMVNIGAETPDDLELLPPFEYNGNN